MPFMNSSSKIRYGATSPGQNWVYGGKTRNPSASPKQGWQTTDYWVQRPPAPAPPAPPPEPSAPAAPAAPVAQAAATETKAEIPKPPGPSQSELYEKKLKDQISVLTAGFTTQLTDQAATFNKIRQEQEDRITALQEEMKQSQAAAAAANRPTVAGVKTATGSAGTDMQIARRGVRGAFSRAGMRIQSLNV